MNNTYTFGTREASNVIIRLMGAHETEYINDEAKRLEAVVSEEQWCMVVVPVSDWEQEMAPFGDGAKAKLERILEEIIPDLEKDYPDIARRYIIAGYSLAGLFALWSSYQSDRFHGVVAASPSVWYPAWIEYADSYKCYASNIYLSLGKKEHKTRNRLMATVKDCIQVQHDILDNAGISVCLEWNEGNHFTDPSGRIIKGIEKMLRCI